MSGNRTLRYLIGLGALLCTNGLAQPSNNGLQNIADGTKILSEAINPRVRREDDRGFVDSARKLSQLTLIFRRTPGQRAALERLLEQLQDPSSPNYHRWLTPEEFADRFGASADSVDRVVEWLRSEGFTVESRARGRGWIVFSGTVAQLQNTFHTEIHRYQVGAKLHYAPTAPPSIPAELANLIGGIRGLDDLYLEPSIRLEPKTTLKDGSHALVPGDVAKIYNFSTDASTGTGQTIAVVGNSAVDLADIRQFRSMFQLPPNDPKPLLAGDDPGMVSGSALQEANADLEWVGAVAHNATIIYAYATDVIVASQNVIDQNLAAILSFSLGGCEPDLSQSDATFLRDLAQQANAQGMTWIAASGDWGAATCDHGSNIATHGLAVSFPASVPEVTGVGGTEFNEPIGSWNPFNSPDLSSAFGYFPEIGWNDTSSASGLRASGGGASVLYPKPSWQTAPGVPNDGARDVPDLALDASPTHDPYIVISGGKTYAAGGTSLGTPVFAGMLALSEASQGGNGPAASGFGNINPSLYNLANQSYANQIFHDITSGNNLVPCAAGTPNCENGSLGYTAGPGYDLVTGLGSVNTASLESAFQFGAAITVSASAMQVTAGMPVTFTAIVRKFNGSIATGSVILTDLSGYSSAGTEHFVSLDSSGKAQATFVLLLGTHLITAKYFDASGSPFSSSISGPITITVIPGSPPAPILVSPANNATNVPVGTQLSWNNPGFPASNPSYDVYFGTTQSPPFWGHVLGGPRSPGALAPNITYYWRVVATDQLGSAASPVWSFTTTGIVYTITTITGMSATVGFSPDGTPAANALLWNPSDVALDRNGNLYLVDSGYAEGDGRVRMIDSAGVLSTVAGGGTGGDGGAAIAAQLTRPHAITIDGQGNLYLTDSPNRIRKVSPNGIITTIAGGSTAGYDGDGGPAVNAHLNFPLALAVDSQGNLYIADALNHCVREITAGIISTFAGQCTISGSDGDGGPATSASLNGPTGVAVGADGTVYIADVAACKIRKVANGIIAAVADFTVSGQQCYGPQSLAVDSTGNLYFTQFYSVSKFSNGLTMLIAGGGQADPGNGGPGTSADLYPVGGLAVNSAGKIFFVEGRSIRMLAPSYTPPLPSIAAGGVVNGASFAPAPLSPGSIADVFGSFGFGSPAQASGAPLPTALSGSSVQFQFGTGINAPLFYASTGQINMQVPWEVAGQSSVSIRPVLNGTLGTSQGLQLKPFAPGIFTTGPPGSTQGAIVDSSYRIVDIANPAFVGSSIQIYCTGLGLVTNPPASGSAASIMTLSETTTKPTVMIGGIPAKVVFSGLAPGTVGEYQVNAEVPAGVTPGLAVPVVLSIGGVSSNTVTIRVQ